MILIRSSASFCTVTLRRWSFDVVEPVRFPLTNSSCVNRISKSFKADLSELSSSLVLASFLLDTWRPQIIMS